MGLWHMAYINHLNMFVLATCAVMWYFASNRHRMGGSILQAFWWAFFWNLGTVAFGSFILMLIWVIQIVLAYIHKKVKESTGEDSNASKLLCCLQCIAKCFERIIQFVSKHAYVETAIRCIGFCRASQKAFSVVTSNFLRFGVLNGLAELAMLFGNMLIAAATTAVGFFLLKLYGRWKNVVFETFAPLIVNKKSKANFPKIKLSVTHFSN